MCFKEYFSLQKLLKLNTPSLSIAYFSFYSCLQQHQAEKLHFNIWKYTWDFQTALLLYIISFIFLLFIMSFLSCSLVKWFS